MISPFPYFGGKRKIADAVWDALGDTPNYVEPFAGSLAVLLARPHDYRNRIETVNDADGMLANYWRATQHDPDAVAHWADWPVNEADLHARHLWLVGERERITERLMGDPAYYDAKSAGWWLWGICQWIGSGWCSGDGPWVAEGGVFVKRAGGVRCKLPQLGSAGQGVNRQLPHLGSAGRGVNRQLPPTCDDEGLCAEWSAHLRTLMRELSDRLRRVRVCCGDWSRVCGTAPTIHNGLTGVFLDPPYSAAAGRDPAIYSVENLSVAHDVREWAIAHGDDPKLRIALCGYDGEHAMPEGWTTYHWTAHGGYGARGQGRGRANREREVIWFSPYCLRPEPADYALFEVGG